MSNFGITPLGMVQLEAGGWNSNPQEPDLRTVPVIDNKPIPGIPPVKWDAVSSLQNTPFTYTGGRVLGGALLGGAKSFSLGPMLGYYQFGNRYDAMGITNPDKKDLSHLSAVTRGLEVRLQSKISFLDGRLNVMPYVGFRTLTRTEFGTGKVTFGFGPQNKGAAQISIPEFSFGEDGSVVNEPYSTGWVGGLAFAGVPSKDMLAGMFLSFDLLHRGDFHLTGKGERDGGMFVQDTETFTNASLTHPGALVPMISLGGMLGKYPSTP